MQETIFKKCAVCAREGIHKRIVSAGLVLWHCLECKADSPFRLIGVTRYSERKDNPDEGNRPLGTHTVWILGLLIAGIALSACQKKEDAPGPSVPHVAGSWAGTGTDDAIGFYNVGMDLTQSGGSAGGSFRMVGGAGSVDGSVSLAIGPDGGNNLQSFKLTRSTWTTTDPANANRLCAGDLTVRSGSTSMSSSAIVFHYTMTDCQGGNWEGGANLKKQAGTN